ncbi:MAG: Holliday junction resolvase RuvX [Oscillospiraceae bacterium]|jgi:putative Holliday junction resolvase|nr:Holliday junction resolvase RuvX [Oscillospiraceae bacterium]
MRILAVDYGDVRTGLAVCDMTETLASPHSVIHERNENALIQKIMKIVSREEIGEIVVGNPINMNNTRGPRSEKCAAFAEKLREAANVPVLLWDERATTSLAHTLLNEADKKGKKRKNVIDAAAAAVILESYLNYRRNKK